MSQSSQKKKHPNELTHYEVLRVDPGAHSKIIYCAYRYLSVVHSPVDVRNNDPEMLSLVGLAWQTLSDPAKRAEYDKTLGI